jgi:hypothetical protein
MFVYLEGKSKVFLLLYRNVKSWSSDLQVGIEVGVITRLCPLDERRVGLGHSTTLIVVS